jgi:hypothetical protein
MEVVESSKDSEVSVYVEESRKPWVALSIMLNYLQIRNIQRACKIMD